MDRPCLVPLVFLLLSLPANALFLAGQSEQGGAISVLCEGQSTAFVSFPSGEMRALALDAGYQASISPEESGPYTFQCGNETKTIDVRMPARADSGAYSGGEIPIFAAGAALVFLAALFLAARAFLAPKTTFSKSAIGTRVRLLLRAGEDLRGIRISDPQGGGDGAPLELSIPRLEKGKAWEWEYELAEGEQLLFARMCAKGKRGDVSLVSGVENEGGKAGKGKKRGLRKLEKSGS